MKKRVKIVIGMCVVLGVMATAAFGVVYHNKTKDVISAEEMNNEIVTNVIKGNIAQKYTTKGQVVSQNPEIYIEELEIRGVNSKNFSMIKNKGEDIIAKEEFYIHNGRKKSVDFNGKILDVKYNKDENGNYAVVTLLNYDNLYINAKIDADELKEINHENKVNILYKGKTYEGKVSLINYEIEDGEVLVQIKHDGKLYPGSDVYVDFVKNAKEDRLYVPEKAIIKEYGNTYAILSQDGQENKQVEVTIGETFYEKTDDGEDAFVEIVSGLKEGDLVVINQEKNELNMEDL